MNCNANFFHITANIFIWNANLYNKMYSMYLYFVIHFRMYSIYRDVACKIETNIGIKWQLGNFFSSKYIYLYSATNLQRVKSEKWKSVVTLPLGNLLSINEMEKKRGGEGNLFLNQYGCFESFPFCQNFVIFVRQITWFRWTIRHWTSGVNVHNKNSNRYVPF